jgi:CheY-like chemotaxis protein
VPPSETVLLVEDDERVRLFVTNVLKRNGYRVLEAHHAQGALEIAGRHVGAIDLLLTDVVMPGLNGRELAERLCAVQPGIRVLFMSGYSSDAILERGIRASEVQFIQKPFTIDALTAKVRDVLAAADRR